MGQDENLDHHHQKVDVDGNGDTISKRGLFAFFLRNMLIFIMEMLRSNCPWCQIVNGVKLS